MKWPPHMQFFIEHRADIADVLELDRRVREELPSQLAKGLLAEIRNDFGRSPWEGFDSDWKSGKSGEEISWWSSHFYDTEAELGPYFGAESFSSVFETEEDDRPQLFLRFYKKGHQRSRYRERLQAVVTAVDTVVLKGVQKATIDKGDLVYLASQPVNLTLEMLAEPGNAAEVFINQARAFAETFAPLFPRLSN
jgi:hypothetical protein